MQITGKNPHGCDSCGGIYDKNITGISDFEFMLTDLKYIDKNDEWASECDYIPIDLCPICTIKVKRSIRKVCFKNCDIDMYACTEEAPEYAKEARIHNAWITAENKKQKKQKKKKKQKNKKKKTHTPPFAIPTKSVYSNIPMLQQICSMINKSKFSKYEIINSVRKRHTGYSTNQIKRLLKEMRNSSTVHLVTNKVKAYSGMYVVDNYGYLKWKKIKKTSVKKTPAKTKPIINAPVYQRKGQGPQMDVLYGLLVLHSTDIYTNPKNTKINAKFYKFKCACGTIKLMQSTNVVYNSTKSCGCLKDTARKYAKIVQCTYWEALRVILHNFKEYGYYNKDGKPYDASYSENHTEYDTLNLQKITRLPVITEKDISIEFKNSNFYRTRELIKDGICENKYSSLELAELIYDILSDNDTTKAEYAKSTILAYIIECRNPRRCYKRVIRFFPEDKWLQDKVAIADPDTGYLFWGTQEQYLRITENVGNSTTVEPVKPMKLSSDYYKVTPELKKEYPYLMEKYGFIYVKEHKLYIKEHKSHVEYICQCGCGKELMVSTTELLNSLSSNKILSCGCFEDKLQEYMKTFKCDDKEAERCLLKAFHKPQ